MSQWEPLHNFDAQQAAQEHGERLTLANLSAVEKEALTLLRLHPRILALFADTPEVSAALKAQVEDVQAALLRKGVIEHVPSLGKLFVRLTPEGLRLQAVLWQQGGVE
jgi:hypothetical protein